jgi:hypothetical protein
MNASHYLFAEHNGSRIDDLGSKILDDDHAAPTFGQNIVVDLMLVGQPTGGFLNITSGERQVATISFEKIVPKLVA